MIYTTFDSPIGELLLAGDDSGLRLLSMQAAPRPRRIGRAWRRDDEGFAVTRAQLEQYFAGTRREFDVELSLHGNPFELRVWQELCEIPYGEAVSYGEIAHAIDAPSAARAVGLANARTPWRSSSRVTG
jgi:methylated-DNA-[protein]-cysteine S-methyltransferase